MLQGQIISTPYGSKLAKTRTEELIKMVTDKQSRNRLIEGVEPLRILKDFNGGKDEIDALEDFRCILRIKEMKIKDYPDPIWDKIFKLGGEIYIITTAIDGSGREFSYTTKYFENIREGDKLPLGPGGMLSLEIPNPKWFVDFHMIVMECDSDIRRIGEFIEEALEVSNIKSLLSSIRALSYFDVTKARDVVLGVDFFLQTLQKLLVKNKDDYMASFHDCYLKEQAFGNGMAVKNSFRDVEIEYQIDLVK